MGTCMLETLETTEMRRRNLVVYRVVEPRVSTARDTVEHERVGTAQAIPFKFPEQQDFPPLNVTNYAVPRHSFGPHTPTRL